MLTAVVLAKDEANNLPACLTSLAFCDHLVVIDDNSSDATVAIAKKHGATVLSREMAAGFADQRNWAQSHVKSPWLLFIDADEVVTAELAASIRENLTHPGSTKGYFLRRQDFLWGQPLRHGDTGTAWLLRLARRGSGTWVGAVHETWRITGRTARLAGVLKHRPHPTLAAFLRHLNFYSSLRASELFSDHQAAAVWQILAYPTAKFLHLWIIKRGFLDGTVGFIHATCMAFYSFLVRGKLYLLARGIPHV